MVSSFRHSFPFKAFRFGSLEEFHAEDFVDEADHSESSIDSVGSDTRINVEKLEKPLKGPAVFRRTVGREEMMIKIVEEESLPLDREAIAADLGVLNHHQEDHHPVIEVGPEKLFKLSSRKGPFSIRLNEFLRNHAFSLLWHLPLKMLDGFLNCKGSGKDFFKGKIRFFDKPEKGG